VLTQGEPVHRSDEATGLETEHPGLDRDAIGRLAYFYWEERGCPNDSPDEIGSGQKQKFAACSMPPHHIDKEVRDVTKYDARIYHQPDTSF
jgi:hypothetical protein